VAVLNANRTKEEGGSMTKARISVTYVLDADIGDLPTSVIEALIQQDEDFSIFELGDESGSNISVEDVCVEVLGSKK